MNIIEIPPKIHAVVARHFFQNELEQGAFLFARDDSDAGGLKLVAEDYYLVPPSGWEHQGDIYLQMRDTERGKIMQMARAKGACAIDCHSHPHADTDVWFSPSDVHGIGEFAPYARWKLGGRPFAAIVWGERSVDAIAWRGDFKQALAVDEIRIGGAGGDVMRPTNSWFRTPKSKHRFFHVDE
jgi:hypothetical protein